MAQVTEELIKKMLADTHKGLATRDELKTAVADAVKELFEAEKAGLLSDAENRLGEAQAQIDDLQSQIKQLLNTRFESIKTPEGYYKGVWPDLNTCKNFGLWVWAEFFGNQKAAEQCDALGLERRRMVDNKIILSKDVSGGATSTGGALMPSVFLGLLPVLLGRFGVAAEEALVQPMASDSGYAAVQESDVVVYAPGAGTAPTASNPGFRNIALQARKMMTLTAVDNECTEDMVIAVGEAVGRSILRAFGKKLDQIVFLGDGTSTYFNFMGIGPSLVKLNSSDLSVIRAVRVQATAGAWSAITDDDLLALVACLNPDADDEDSKFYCHRNFYYTVLLTIALDKGGVNATEVIQTGYTRNPQYLGRPVRHVGVMPRVKAAADHWPLFLGNLRQSVIIGQPRALTIEQSKEAYFTTDQLGIRGTMRAAVAVHSIGNLTTDTEELEPNLVGLRADIA